MWTDQRRSSSRVGYIETKSQPGGVTGSRCRLKRKKKKGKNLRMQACESTFGGSRVALRIQCPLLTASSNLSAHCSHRGRQSTHPTLLCLHHPNPAMKKLRPSLYGGVLGFFFFHTCPTRAPGEAVGLHSVPNTVFHIPVSGEEKRDGVRSVCLVCVFSLSLIVYL